MGFTPATYPRTQWSFLYEVVVFVSLEENRSQRKQITLCSAPSFGMTCKCLGSSLRNISNNEDVEGITFSPLFQYLELPQLRAFLTLWLILWGPKFKPCQRSSVMFLGKTRPRNTFRSRKTSLSQCLLLPRGTNDRRTGELLAQYYKILWPAKNWHPIQGSGKISSRFTLPKLMSHLAVSISKQWNMGFVRTTKMRHCSLMQCHCFSPGKRGGILHCCEGNGQHDQHAVK